MLRQQRQIISGKREHLNRAIQAIERAEEVVATGQEPDWESFRKIIEVIQMQTRKDWMKKYYTDGQLADLRTRWSPEVQAESERGWAALVRDTEAAISRGGDPSGTTGRQLAVRRQQLLALFTGGNPGMEESLQKLYADKTNWPASFKKPFSDAVDAFLGQAAHALPKPSAPSL
jgi:MerR family transcriptional regulator, thiopeptide resistance regulator